MFAPFMIVCVIALYMGILFTIALWMERGFTAKKKLGNEGLIYALSLGVFCTAWTYYGSIGEAAASGVVFVTTYIGATLSAVLWWGLLRRLVRIKNTYRITSIADFISARYNKSLFLASAITIIALVGAIPYVALQLKAIISTFGLITAGDSGDPFFLRVGIGPVVVGLMIILTIMFGVRRLDPTERHPGMISVIAVISLIKLVVFISAGIFITYFMYNGFGDIFNRITGSQFNQLGTMGGTEATSFIRWSVLIILSASSVIFLPHQFHIAVVENAREEHILKAMWLFPLYMLLLNIFVLPVAWGGLLKGYPLAEADNFLLLLPLRENRLFLALMVFIGGFSAAAGMVMITSMTMAVMITNHLLLPFVSMFKNLGGLRRHLLKCRWIAAALFIIVSYWFEIQIGAAYMLVNIGMISFAAALQFAPAILGGILWRKGNKAGAIAGVSLGFVVWFYTMLLPSFIRGGLIASSFLEKGPWGIGFLRPEGLFGLNTLDHMTHTVFWSMLFNCGAYVFGSLLFRQSGDEQIIAEDFIHIADTSMPVETYYSGGRPLIDVESKKTLIRGLLHQYFTEQEAEYMLTRCFNKLNIHGRQLISVVELAELLSEVERVFAGSIGTAAAHKAIKERPFFTSQESGELSRVYGEILAGLNVTPRELKRKIDYYQEKESLLMGHAKELAGKVRELEDHIAERKKAEEALRGSESKYRTIFENTGTATVIAEENRVISLANTEFEKLSGYSKDEVENKKSYEEFLSGDDLDKISLCYEHSGSEGDACKYEFRFRDKNGNIKEIFAGVALIPGTRKGVFSFLDITERKKAEKALKESEERLTTMLNFLPTGIILVDAETHNIVYANPMVEEMTGLPKDEIIGEICHKFVCPAAKGKCPITDLGQTMNKSESVLLRADGKAIPILKSVATVILDGRKHLIESFLDITERKQAEEKMRDALSMKSKFTSMVSHELRTPLTAIKEGIELVLDRSTGPVTPSQDEFLNIVKRNVERLTRLINNVLDFSKITSRKVELRLEVININDLIEAVVVSHWPVINNRGLTINSSLAETKGVTIKSDSDKIIQVLNNFLSNAIKFTDHGGITVSTSMEKDSNTLRISVADTGIGIKGEDVPRLFNSFVQLGGPKERRTGGTGLGLAICKELVEQLGGKIAVESSWGRGSKFYFSLPLTGLK